MNSWVCGHIVGKYGRNWETDKNWAPSGSEFLSHRSRLNEVLGEQRGGGTEGTRTNFTLQNMTGPFLSVTRKSFWFNACFTPNLIFFKLFKFTDLSNCMCKTFAGLPQLCPVLAVFALSQVSRGQSSVAGYVAGLHRQHGWECPLGLPLSHSHVPPVLHANSSV